MISGVSKKSFYPKIYYAYWVMPKFFETKRGEHLCTVVIKTVGEFNMDKSY